MASFNKFNAFVENVAEGVHNLGSDTLRVYLSNSTPSASHTAYDGVTGSTGPAEIAAGNGYTAGGNVASVSSSAQTAGVYKLVLNDPAVWTATGGSIGPFRYVVLYNDTSASNALIGYWDYGTSITLATTESFAVDLDATNGVLTIT
jgi:hypothetical protein